LSKIGSGLGKPLYVDTCTTITERITYARILIEMDITKPLPQKIKLHDPKGKVLEQIMHYDWKPQYCQTCCQLGHSCRDQKKQKLQGELQKGVTMKLKQEWRAVRKLDPAIDKIDTQGRFLEQMESACSEQVIQQEPNEN